MTIGIDMDDTICSTNERIIVEADKYDNNYEYQQALF